MKDGEIPMKEMPLLIIQYIMHKKWWYQNQRKIFCGSKRKREQNFREQSLLISKCNPLASSWWFQSTLYFDTSV